MSSKSLQVQALRLYQRHDGQERHDGQGFVAASDGRSGVQYRTFEEGVVGLAHDWEAGQRYVESLGWDRGLCHVLNPAIRREIEARGGTVEEETG